MASFFCIYMHLKVLPELSSTRSKLPLLLLASRHRHTVARSQWHSVHGTAAVYQIKEGNTLVHLHVCRYMMNGREQSLSHKHLVTTRIVATQANCTCTTLKPRPGLYNRNPRNTALSIIPQHKLCNSTVNAANLFHSNALAVNYSISTLSLRRE